MEALAICTLRLLFVLTCRDSVCAKRNLILRRRKRGPAGASCTETALLWAAFGHQPPFFSLQLRQKRVTCSLSSGDPITALKSIPVTMLICSYLHMRPQKSKANCLLPHTPFLRLPPRYCSHHRWQVFATLSRSKLFRKAFFTAFKCPH